MIRQLDLTELAVDFDIDLLSATSAEPLSDAAVKINENLEKGYIQRSPTRFPSLEDIADFCNPRNVMAQARSVLVGAEGYFTEEPEDLSEPGQPHGLIARYTRRNHYRSLRKKLVKLAKRLKRQFGGEYRAYSNGPLAEKPLAQRAGLGFYGKHGIIINGHFGSMIVLGTVVTDLEVQPQEPVKDGCGACRLCIVKCPTKAIVAPYMLDWSRCFQYLTNWHGLLPESFRRLWGKRLYGCSTCQDVCPKNRKVKPGPSHPADGDIGASFPLLRLLKMSEAEYRTVFGANQMAARWVKFDCIRRNAIVALGNAGDPVGVEPLVACLEEKEPMLRAHAAWALGQAGDRKGRSALERARRVETDTAVANEVDAALQRLGGP